MADKYKVLNKEQFCMLIPNIPIKVFQIFETGLSYNLKLNFSENLNCQKVNVFYDDVSKVKMLIPKIDQ